MQEKSIPAPIEEFLRDYSHDWGMSMSSPKGTSLRHLTASALNPLPIDYVIILEVGKLLQSTLIINRLAHEVCKPIIVTI
jgi:hypothetical protein